MNADVLVVGAGLSGLACARQLRKRGLSVQVLEARSRVGGRTLTTELDGATFDLDHQHVSKEHARLLRLLGECGIVATPVDRRGHKVLVLGQQRAVYEGDISSLSELGLLELRIAMVTADSMARRVPTEAPWSTPTASRWDALFASTLSERIRSQSARACLHGAIRSAFGAEAEEISLLWVLFCLHAKTRLPLVGLEDKRDELEVPGGAQTISLRLQETMGDALVLGAPVEGVSDRGDHVIVRARGREFRSRAVVLAIPPPVCRRIAFEPALSAKREALHKEMRVAATVKCVAVYERPFWADAGLSGEAVFDRAPLTMAHAIRSVDGRRHALVGVVCGASARGWRNASEDARKADALTALTRAFGPSAQKPTTYAEYDWTQDTSSSASAMAWMAPGLLTRVEGSLREPFGRVHWAGAETASEFPGDLEGAVQAAERAANEVVKQLSG